MMSSRSIAFRSKALGRVVAIVGLVLAVVCAAPAIADAKPKLVVLDFTGPKAAKFKADVVKIVKKGNTLIDAKKWKTTAKKLKATKPTARNVKKVAKKLKVDGLITGAIERRGKRYYVHLKVRDGQSGEFVADIEVVVRKPKLAGGDARDVKNQLTPAIEDLGGGGGDDGGDDAVATTRGGDDDDKSAWRGGADDADRVANDKDDDGDEPKADDKDDKDDDKDRVAAREDDNPLGDDDDKKDKDDGGASDAEIRGDRGGDEGTGDPRHPAVEIAAGVSVIARKLSFATVADLDDKPQGYSGRPVGGAYVAADFFPLAFSKKNTGFTRDLGVTVMFDRVIKIQSELEFGDPADPEVAVLGTTQQRYAVGLIYRHAFGSSPTGISLEASVRYNQLTFDIDKAAAPAGIEVDIPNVDYTYVDPGLGIRFPFSTKLALLAEVRGMIFLQTGEIQKAEQYGSADVTGLDSDLALQYMLTRNIAIQAGGRFMTIGYAFNGAGELTNNRDGDTDTVDVSGARDSYYGGYATLGYLF